MTDEKIKTILNAISHNQSEKTIGNAEQISYNEIQAKAMHRQIRNFLLAELEFAARTYIKNIKSSRFSFQDDSISAARNEFVRHLIKTATLKREDYLKLLDTAVVIEFRYLCRPQKMLAELVFGQRKEQSATEVYDRLRNFSDYSYLINVFLQYLEKKKIENISREKFEKIISDIDQKIIDSYDDHDFLMLLKPLYEFFDLAGETEVPVLILSEFVREKGVPRLERIISELTAKGIKTLSLKDFDLILHGRKDQIFEEAVVVDETGPQPEQADSSPEADQITALPLQESEPVAEPVAAADTGSEQSLEEWPLEFPTVEKKEIPQQEQPSLSSEHHLKTDEMPFKEDVSIKFDESDIVQQIKESLEAFTPPPRPHKTESNGHDPMPEPPEDLVDNTMILDDTNVPDQASQEELGLESTLSLLNNIPSQQSPSPKIEVSEDFFEKVAPEKSAEIPKPRDPDNLKDLRELIGEADRKKFIKRVFKGKEDAYEDALSQLNGARSWREASLYIDEEIFLRHKIDEYSPEALLFTDIVFSRYKNQPKA